MNKKIIIIAGVIIIILGYMFMNKSSNYTSVINDEGTNSQDTEKETATSTATNTSKTTTTTKPAVVVVKSSSSHVYVDISGSSFSPKALTIKAGTTVTWTNKDSVPHAVLADNGGPTSNNLGKGQSYSFKYSVKGIYGYHCSIHPNMTGTIIVN